jgi:hypothetical protein
MKIRGINKGDRLTASIGAHPSGNGDRPWRDDYCGRLTHRHVDR